jgi:hypothetical protein
MRIYGRAFNADVRGRGVIHSARPRPGREAVSLTVPRLGYQVETYAVPAARRGERLPNEADYARLRERLRRAR